MGTVRPDVPEQLASIIARCLEKKPRDRYPSAAALDDALARTEETMAWPRNGRGWWGLQGSPARPSVLPA